ncbi:MAG TPA: GTPase [Candidatus Saccharimonadales bacterium]|nr:GTPase [Candidatus Saccharimonadales bacterium]
MTVPTLAPLDGPPMDGTDPLDACLQRLLDAADAADQMGIDTARVREAHADAARRLGFPGDAYVLAFVGGTGVGKSSLLNALAGSTVSPASVRRPTTSDPVAWVPAVERADLDPLLAWLGVRDIREHAADALGPVAILDLPDMDSVAAEHRSRVEAILPRVDAVAWVVDPEKYHDAALHDAFLRAWLPRLARQVVVVNKADRLTSKDAERVRRDLERDLGAARASAAPPVPILLTSAAPAAGTAAPAAPDVQRLRAWLSDGVAAKRIVRDRIAATVLDGGATLARDAGIDPSRPNTPFLAPAARTAAIDAATAAVLRTVDLGGLERQAEAATRARARSKGTGPIGRLTGLIYRASGRETRVADPAGYLVRWRERGPLTPAVEVLREALAAPLRAASPSVRARLAAALEPAPLRLGLERAVDRSIVALGPLEAPASRWWRLFGLLQTLATVAIALSVAWVVIWVLGGPSTSTVDVPVLGEVATPFASLVVSLLIGYLLARLLGAHAGWVGRRWARTVRDRVATAVRSEIAERGLRPLDETEDARRRLWTAASTLRATCGTR